MPDIGEFEFGHGAGRFAGLFSVDAQKPSDLVQAEAHGLCSANELKAGHISRAVVTDTTLWAKRFGKQPAALVVTHRFHIDVACCRELTDGEMHEA